MYLEVMPSGSKVWRMAYRQPSGKNNRLTFGPYPEISLLDARTKCAAARKLLAEGIDPGQAKREDKHARSVAAIHTFEAVARTWLAKTAADRAISTQEKNTAWLERNIFPHIGEMPVSAIKPRDVLAALNIIEARGAMSPLTKSSNYAGRYSGSRSRADWRNVT